MMRQKNRIALYKTTKLEIHKIISVIKLFYSRVRTGSGFFFNSRVFRGFSRVSEGYFRRNAKKLETKYRFIREYVRGFLRGLEAYEGYF